MSLTPPNPIIKPFCNSGTQITPPVGADTFIANQETGFPDSQATPLPAGTEVKQDEMNGVLKFYTSLILWLNSGGQFTFNQAFSDANNGYAKNNILWCESTNSFQRSLIDNNTANFVTNPSYINDGINWISTSPLIIANNSARAYYIGNSSNIANPNKTFAYVSEVPVVKYKQLLIGSVSLQIHAIYDPIAMIWLCSCSGKVNVASNGTEITPAIIGLSGIATVLNGNYGTVGGFAGTGGGLAIEGTDCAARSSNDYLNQELIMYIKWNQAIPSGTNIDYTFSIIFTASNVV